MSSLLERIDADLVAARKARDEVALDTLGVLKSEVVNAGKEPGASGAGDDALVLRVVRRELKQREESAEAYAGAGREETARVERAKADLLRGYLPAQLSDSELEQEVAAVIAEVKPQGPRDMGAVMKAANARLAGRAEGGRIAAVARRLLAS
ncbi:MAG: GatB/YqeY domain-containing protein [Candidatus Dormibacteraeota bacterium]|nr:GatB/YqeY domain-containing protein [Candidatus Dormibacteraeota bacterium]